MGRSRISGQCSVAVFQRAARERGNDRVCSHSIPCLDGGSGLFQTARPAGVSGESGVLRTIKWRYLKDPESGSIIRLPHPANNDIAMAVPKPEVDGIRACNADFTRVTALAPNLSRNGDTGS